MLLETTGFLSAQGVILTQISLGTTFEAWTGEVYDDSEFQESVASYQEVIQGVRAQLYSLYKYGGLHPDDEDFIEILIEVYDAINKESNSMLKYSYTKKDVDYNQYMADREDALNKLNFLFE